MPVWIPYLDSVVVLTLRILEETEAEAVDGKLQTTAYMEQHICHQGKPLLQEFCSGVHD